MIRRTLFTVLSFWVLGTGCASAPSKKAGADSSQTTRTTASDQSEMKIVLIGDSHTTGYATSQKRGPARSPGLRLSELLMTLQNTVVATFGSCGSQTQTWVNGVATRCGYFERTPTSHLFSPKGSRTPKISKLLKDEKPDLVIVALGANFLPEDYSASDIETYASDFVKLITQSGATCAWVGPPHAQKYGDLSAETTQKRLAIVDQALRAGAGKNCPYVSTLEFARYPAGRGDGLHHRRLGKTGAELSGQWANRAMEELRSAVPALENR